MCLFLLFFFPHFLIVVCLYMFSKSLCLRYGFLETRSLCLRYGFLEKGISREADSLSPGIKVRLAYILHFPDPINSFAKGWIILGMVLVVGRVNVISLWSQSSSYHIKSFWQIVSTSSTD
ncbi:hypothetical protein Hanom_Chr11g01024021 [Helianthus anomalus]